LVNRLNVTNYFISHEGSWTVDAHKNGLNEEEIGFLAGLGVRAAEKQSKADVNSARRHQEPDIMEGKKTLDTAGCSGTSFTALARRSLRYHLAVIPSEFLARLVWGNRNKNQSLVIERSRRKACSPVLLFGRIEKEGVSTNLTQKIRFHLWQRLRSVKTSICQKEKGLTDESVDRSLNF